MQLQVLKVRRTPQKFEENVKKRVFFDDFQRPRVFGRHTLRNFSNIFVQVNSQCPTDSKNV